MIYNHMQEDPEQDRKEFRKRMIIVTCILIVVIILNVIKHENI